MVENEGNGQRCEADERKKERKKKEEKEEEEEEKKEMKRGCEDNFDAAS